MYGMRFAAAALAAGMMVVSAAGIAAAEDKKPSKYFVYKTEQGCSVVMNATKKTSGEKLAGPFKSKANAEKRVAKLTTEKKC
jgi:hypothetical protein